VLGRGHREDEVLDLLSHLVDKSLVLVAEQGGEEARYRLLETVRQYGWERLSEWGEIEGIRGRHARFFLIWWNVPSRPLWGQGSRRGWRDWSKNTTTCGRL
jgi:predicted ATPase